MDDLWMYIWIAVLAGNPKQFDPSRKSLGITDGRQCNGHGRFGCAFMAAIGFALRVYFFCRINTESTHRRESLAHGWSELNSSRLRN